MANTGYHLRKVNTHKAIHTCFPYIHIGAVVTSGKERTGMG